MNNTEQKAHDLAVQYTRCEDKNGNTIYDARCEWALLEMAEWCDQRHGWAVDYVTAVEMSHKYVQEHEEEMHGLTPRLRAIVQQAFMAGCDAVHEELTGRPVITPF